MTLDSKALEALAWRDLEIAADATGKLEVARVTLPIEKVRALVECRRSALPAGEAGELVAELRNEVFRHELQHLRSSVEIDHLFQKAATALTSLSACIEAVEDLVRAFLQAHDEGPGLIDCIDNQGERYTSQFLDETIQKARTLSRRATTGSGE